jgi:hypothetical protein
LLPKKPEPGSDDDPDWMKFWEIWPKKVSKPEARKAWAKAVKKAPTAEILAGAEHYRILVIREKREKQHIKDPSGWLNGERWTDEVSVRRGINGGTGQPIVNPRDEWKFRP